MEEIPFLFSLTKAGRVVVQRGSLFSILALACFISVLSPRVTSAQALVKTITVTPAPACNPLISVGIAFDGSELLVSCWSNFTVTRVNPATGAALGSYTITGMLPADGGIGAMAWDADFGQLWVASSQSLPQHVYKVKLNKTFNIGIAIPAFTHTPGGMPEGLALVDGLGYDGTDPLNKFIWFGPDVDDTIYQYTTAGTLHGSHSGLCGAPPAGIGCKSGIAVADTSTLYLANDGGSQIYSTSKTFTGFTLFASTQSRLEDLECDNKTFAPLGALWSKNTYDWILNAFQVPAGRCAQGGVVKPPVCEQGEKDNGKGQVMDEKGGNGGNFDDDERDENHNLEHDDSDHGMRFKESTHSAIMFDKSGLVATTVGQGVANGNPVRFVLVQTGGVPGDNFYSLTLSDSSGVIYRRSGKLISGGINVSH
jgi:hypothetical protein